MNHTAADAATIQSLGKVAVLYGGRSAERDISLLSGGAVVTALQQAGVQVLPVDIGQNPIAQLAQVDCDRAFIALHGPGGEDGKIQALLEFMGIPYTGSGVCASALTMDKLLTKHLWRGLGLSTPDYQMLNATQDWQAVIDALGGVVMVKPCHEGSSLGMAKVDDAEQLRAAYESARRLDPAVLAEQYIRGAEYTVAILGDQALPPIKLETDHQFYDYDAKYWTDDTRYICPCGLPEEREAEIRALALAAFHAVGARGWGRVDIMQDQQGRFYLLEINTVPGMTDHSLVPMAARAQGLTFTELVLRILQQTLEDSDGCAG